MRQGKSQDFPARTEMRASEVWMTSSHRTCRWTVVFLCKVTHPPPAWHCRSHTHCPFRWPGIEARKRGRITFSVTRAGDHVCKSHWPWTALMLVLRSLGASLKEDPGTAGSMTFTWLLPHLCFLPPALVQPSLCPPRLHLWGF